MATLQKITPCLWFDSEVEEAATFYTGIFPNSRITQISRYGEAGREIHGKTPGSVMVAAFELDGQAFTALNGGPRPQFRFNEAISFQVSCETQAEVDHYWDRLSEGGEERAQQCGWLKDRFLRYRDAPTAIRWLCEAFGFEEHAVHANPDGSIAHAQLTFGNGMVMLGSVLAEETPWGRLIGHEARVAPCYQRS